MKKIIFLICSLISVIFIVFYLHKNHLQKKITIAILQGMSNPGLNEGYKSFINEMNILFDKESIEYIYFNADGSFTNALTIAQQIYANKNINGFFTINTIATQALCQLEKQRPIVFIAVDDQCDISSTQENRNFCGILDGVPASISIDFIHKITPNAQHIGLLYKNETTRKKIAEEIKEKLEKNNYTVTELTPLNEIEVIPYLESAIHNVDVVLSPCDGLISATMPLIISYTIKHKKPFLVCLKEGAFFGALASRGTDYNEDGKQAAHYLYEILINNKNASQMPLTINTYEKIYINQETTKKIDFVLPNNNDFTLIK